MSDNLSSLSLGRRRLRLEPLEAVVEYLSTFLLVHWNTTREIPAIVVSMDSIAPRPGNHLQLLSLFAWDIGTHVPGI